MNPEELPESLQELLKNDDGKPWTKAQRSLWRAVKDSQRSDQGKRDTSI